MNKQMLKSGTAFFDGNCVIMCSLWYVRKNAVHDNINITEFAITASADSDASVVYMTKDISPEGLVKLYKRLNFDDKGKTAVKISTGESSSSNNLAPALIKDLVQSVDGTLVECNTAYNKLR